MGESSRNNTLELLRAILEDTKEERQALSVQSVCQYVSCRFSINDDENHNTTCHVSPASSKLVDGSATDNVLDQLAKYTHLYIYPLFIFMGILGNSLSCFIMFTNVRRNGYPTSLYLTFLAFVDCLFLLGSALPDWISKFYYELDINTFATMKYTDECYYT